MEAQNILNLAACALKAIEGSKRAEAHARACRVYAKKVTKKADEARRIANDLIKFAKEMVVKVSEKGTDTSEITLADLKDLIAVAGTDTTVIDASVLRAILSCQDLKCNEDDDQDVASKLTLEKDKMTLLEESINQRLKAPAPEDSDDTDDSSLYEDAISGTSPKSSTASASDPAVISSLGSNKRKNKSRSCKTKVSGILSPLLSLEDVTLIRSSTTSLPSQHSGLSHRKYSMRRKSSVSSQQTYTDEEDYALPHRTTDLQKASETKSTKSDK